CYRQYRFRYFKRIAIGLPFFVCFLIFYLLYNKTLTNSLWITPRHLYNPNDVLGFGKGIGFYGQHTLGAGLVNTDEMMTSLTIMLFGWPFYFSLACIILPFLLWKVRQWDILHGCIILLFIFTYIGYFYHGIAYGPR